MSSSLNDTLRQLWAREKFTYGVRVFIALAGAMALCWYLDRIAFVIPLFLGCIASALAESDDHWRGRTQALLVTLQARRRTTVIWASGIAARIQRLSKLTWSITPDMIRRVWPSA